MFLGVAFFLLIFVVFGFLSKNYYAYAYNRFKIDSPLFDRQKMPAWVIFFFGLCSSLLNFYCTSISVGMGDDRKNYLFDFNGYRSASIGLDFIFLVIKSFYGDIYTVFYLTTFVCCVLTLYAYKKSKDANYHTLIFLLSTNFVIFTFTGLKQCYTCAFAAMVFALATRTRTFKRDVACILIIIAACLFHSTGFILIPSFLFIRFFGKNSRYIKLTLVLLLAVSIFIQPISMALARLVAGPLPQLAYTLTTYMGSESLFGSSRNINFLQGFPIYIVLIWGMLNRKRIKDSEKKYDLYLTFTAIGALFYGLSFFSYWMYRFTSIFYLPIGIMYSILMKHELNNNKLFLAIGVVGVQLFFTLRAFVLVYTMWGGF